MAIEKVKVRFAPSPTGIPHIGNIRTALFNYLFAKHTGGEFILRIEDTDQKRLVKEAEDAIYESLSWLGLKHDGEVIHQSQRLDIYKKHARILIDKKVAYEKDGAVWVLVPKNKAFEWKDLIGNKNIRFEEGTQEDFVILKSDGFPTYHLANVIDDHLMGITHVIRGEEWISSVPKHIYLYGSFGWGRPEFAHLPVILGPDKSKLSKRHGAKSVLDYRDEGFLKETIINFMALLGWNPGGDKEQLGIDEISRLFRLEDVNTANPIFNEKKLEWLNGVWIRLLASKGELEPLLKEKYKNDEKISLVFTNSHKDLIIKLASDRMKTLNDFQALVMDVRKELKLSAEDKKIVLKLAKLLETEKWEEKDFIEVLRKFNKEEKVDFKRIYYLLTGKKEGLPLSELLLIYGGKEEFLKTFKSNIK